MKPKPPVFHIPTGWRRENGEVVLFKDEADQTEALKVWMQAVENHPATVAAGACVIIGPTMTQFVDYTAKNAVVSDASEGAWQPSAVADLTNAAEGQTQRCIEDD